MSPSQHAGSDASRPSTCRHAARLWQLPVGRRPWLRCTALLQVHGMHTVADLLEVISKERDTRSLVGLWEKAAAAADGGADGSAAAAQA